MNGVNKVILIGTLGKDPDIKQLNNGSTVCNMILATTESWLDNNGQKKEKTEWHKVVLFGRLAEVAGEYLSKGSKAYIEGKLATRKWQDQSGQDRYTTEVNGNQMQMLGGNTRQGQQGSAPMEQQGKPAPPQNQKVAATKFTADIQSDAEFDDDVPF